MIPNAVDVAEITTNMTGDSGKFTVDQDSLAHIMQVLTNLYADPEGAVVREYLTNAYDSHIEAGQTRPVEITTPSGFNSAYIIRDYGIGMSVDDLKNIYSKYGKSTKRDSNEVVGMLGLGSKSALTYTNQFSITGIKDGVQAKAIISINEEGVPEFQVVDTRTTTEPNGVEIKIPAKNHNTFAAKLAEFLKYWEPGLVLVNGRAPVHHGLKEVKPGIFLQDSVGRYNAPTSYVVMGNVPYAVDDQYIDQKLRDVRMGYVAYVPMGAVTFQPNRERLIYNAKTKAAVADLSKGLFEHARAEAIKGLADSATYKDALEAYDAVPNVFLTGNETFRGHKFVNNFMHQHFKVSWGYNDMGYVEERHYLYTSVAKQPEYALIVTGCKAQRLSSAFKKKVAQYLRNNNQNPYNCIAYVVDTDVDNVWWSDIKRVTYDDMKAIKLTGNAAPTPRTETPYDFYYLDASDGLVSDSQSTVDITGYEIAYCSPADFRPTRYHTGTGISTIVDRMPRKTLLVVMGTNRYEKFLRTHPTARKLGDVLRDHLKALTTSISKQELAVDSLTYSETAWCKVATASHIDDPDLSALVTAVKSGTSVNFTKAKALCDWAFRVKVSLTMPTVQAVTPQTRKYPLLDHAGSSNIKHTTFYVNAWYNENIK